VAVSHRSRRRWFGRGRTRALLTLGVIASLGAVGTSAYWTDSATVTGGTITSGTMDMQVAQTTAGPWGAMDLGTDYSAGHIAVSNMVPGGSAAFSLAVQNVGDADFTYTAAVTQGSSQTWGFVSTPITVQLFRGGTPTNSSIGFPPSGTCPGGTSLGPAVTVTNGASQVLTNPERVDHGASEALCVVVAMSPNAVNDNQGKQGQLQFNLTATQVTS